MSNRLFVAWPAHMRRRVKSATSRGQTIMDLRGRVHGYELLFRDGPETIFRGDGEIATRTMFDNAVLFGLGPFTGSLPAFVNCTAEALDG